MKCLRYQPRPLGKNPVQALRLGEGSISMLQSWGTDRLRHDESSKPGADGATESQSREKTHPLLKFSATPVESWALPACDKPSSMPTAAARRQVSNFKLCFIIDIKLKVINDCCHTLGVKHHLCALLQSHTGEVL